jgi:hypothetical protein
VLVLEDTALRRAFRRPTAAAPRLESPLEPPAHAVDPAAL